MANKNMKKGFTMIEMLIVVGIVVVLFGGVAISSYIFRNQLIFTSAVNSIKNIADEAKNYSLSSLSYPDTTDYDGDGRDCPDPADKENCDRILPNGYILDFDASETTVKISLYADLFSSSINTLDPENDLLIKSIELPENIEILARGGSRSGEVYDLPNTFSIMYGAPDADFYVLNGLPPKKDNFQIYIRQTDSVGKTLRSKYVYFHNMNNTAQIMDKIMLRTAS